MSSYWVRKVIVYPIIGDDELWDKVYDSLEEDGKFEISPMESNIENQFFLEYTISEQGGSGEWCKEYHLPNEERECWGKQFSELLDKFDIEVDVSKLKKLEYCYYNGCDALDYYHDERLWTTQ